MSNIQEDARLVPIFKVMAVPNEFKSKEAGRPIFEDLEICEIRFGGDRQKISVFPAHAFSANVQRPDGTTEPMTYAQRFNEQYRRFKANKQQVQEGTPVGQLPFLTHAKREELKALNIHTAETLASLDGEALKSLGMGGRDLKNQAVAYIENAAHQGNASILANENAQLQAQLKTMQDDLKALKASKVAVDEEDNAAKTESLTVDELKDWITAKTGKRPHGNPSKATLVKMAEELQAQQAAE